MSFLASVVLNRAAQTLLDVSQRTWSSAEKIGYLNEALAATAAADNDFYVVTSSFAPAAGVEQALPADGVGLIDVPRNTGGRPVTQVDRSLLDEATRFGTPSPSAAVEHFTFDSRSPRRFVIYPPNTGAGHIDIVYAAVPATVVTAGDTIAVNASYEPALVQYVLACCWAKNSKRQDLAKSSACLQQWGGLLGLDAKTIVKMTPKVAMQPGTTT